MGKEQVIDALPCPCPCHESPVVRHAELLGLLFQELERLQDDYQKLFGEEKCGKAKLEHMQHKLKLIEALIEAEQETGISVQKPLSVQSSS